MRTAKLGGAHVEYFRGIANPIAVQDPATTPEGLLDLIAVLSPRDEPGRLTLIHRFGAGAIADRLPPLVEAVARAGRRVLWRAIRCTATPKPPQGARPAASSTSSTSLGAGLVIHQWFGSNLPAAFTELTGENVTEGTGGARAGGGRPDRAYRTQVDPRLNHEQVSRWCCASPAASAAWRSKAAPAAARRAASSVRSDPMRKTEPQATISSSGGERELERGGYSGAIADGFPSGRSAASDAGWRRRPGRDRIHSVLPARGAPAASRRRPCRRGRRRAA